MYTHLSAEYLLMTPPKGRPRSKGRTGSRWRAVHARCRARAASGVPCTWCGARINVAITYPHPYSFAADHNVELCEGGIPYEVEPIHKVCNEAKELARRKAAYVAKYQYTYGASREW